MSIGERATILAQQGKAAQALAELESAAAREDADAIFVLAIWRLSGLEVSRDLALARRLFRRGADAGHAISRQVYNAFLAHGAGGKRDWTAAMAMLTSRAATEPGAARDLDVIAAMQLTEDGSPISIPGGRMVSLSPHVELFPGAFTPAECRYLIEMAEPNMQAALTIHPQTGQRLPHPIRTSDAAGFPLVSENPAVHALNRRIAAISGLSTDHGEPLQVLRYRVGQQYRAHNDVLPGADNQRVSTVLVYLNDDYTGGETLFLATGLAIRGAVGDALTFRNVKEDGRPDERAVHAGLPVSRGTKLIASRWIRARPLDLMRPS